MRKSINLAVLTLIFGVWFTASAEHAPLSVPATSVQAWQRIKGGALAIDTRSPEEFASGHLPGAINIPHDQIEERWHELGPALDREIVVYCKSGRRSEIAKQTLERLKFSNVTNGGGIAELIEAESNHR